MENKEILYTKYLQTHISNVKKAFELFCFYINKNSLNLGSDKLQEVKNNLERHDASKFDKEEFLPYVKYFYGEKTAQTKADFKVAVQRHKKINPHHPEYWTASASGQLLKTLMICQLNM